MFNTIKEAIEDIKMGKMLVVVDDEDRENEGDLVIAGEYATADAINFMSKYGRGLICVSITEERAKTLDFNLMTKVNEDKNKTAFTVSVDYRGTSTGISAYERSLTIEKILNSDNKNDFNRPGHMFPLIGKEGGVLERNGHTEAAIDLARLAKLKPCGVICEIMKDDGKMARRDDLLEFAKEHKLKIITIKDLIKYREQKENLEKIEEINMPTKYGDFKLHGFINKIDGTHHLALTKGEFNKDEYVLTRIHSECLTGDVFGSDRCDCGEQLEYAMRKISETGKGVILYMRQEGRGIGLINKLKAYKFQEEGYDTVEANLKLGFDSDMRDYNNSAKMLKSLGIEKIMLMTNNPAKIEGLKKYGVKDIERIQIEMKSNKANEKYLKTKKCRMNHILKEIN